MRRDELIRVKLAAGWGTSGFPYSLIVWRILAPLRIRGPCLNTVLLRAGAGRLDLAGAKIRRKTALDTVADQLSAGRDCHAAIGRDGHLHMLGCGAMTARGLPHPPGSE